jgi:methylisocitrate lyase
MADLGLAQLHDMKTNAEMIANLDPFGAPLIADMDTGYGGMRMERWSSTTRIPS